MGKVNYQLVLNGTIEGLAREGRRPSLLLHACCAPCSSYVLEYLREFFRITVFFYNPNISPFEEYDFRCRELQRLIDEMFPDKSVDFAAGEYDPQRFFALAQGLEALPEGGERCMRCYRLRLETAANFAAAHGFDYFTTTLSVSPYKNSEKLNAIGGEAGAAFGVPYLFSDFKKRNGYRRSIELSAEYGLYRQNYCGCVYSYEEMKRKTAHD